MAQTEMELVNLSYEGKQAAELARIADRLEQAGPQEIIRWALDEFRERIVIATGFGVEGMALLDMAVKVNPFPNVFFIDTGFLFPETYELRRRIEDRYGIVIEAFGTSLTPEAQAEAHGPRLWESDPDKCCRIRKLDPLKDALKGRAAWMTAIRRNQSPTRASSRAVERDRRWQIVKVNPLVGWSKRDVWRYVVKNDVPYNPLHDEGYPSIGCTNCTRPITAGEDERAGRWSGHVKTECGLHGGAEALSLQSPGRLR